MISHSLSIMVVDDPIFEAKDEIFSIGLSTNATGLPRLKFCNGILTISDDDSKLGISYF